MKLMYLAKRNNAYSAEDFIPRWRQHGALAMSFPQWEANKYYVQADTIRPSPIEGASQEYDGVELTILGGDPFSNQEDGADKTGQALTEDELKAFDGPVLPRSVIVTEETIAQGPRHGTTAFLWFNDAAQARETAGRLADVADDSRVLLNIVNDEIAISEDPLHDFKAVVEVGARDIESLKTLLDKTAGDPVADADIVVVTAETVLWHKD